MVSPLIPDRRCIGLLNTAPIDQGRGSAAPTRARPRPPRFAGGTPHCGRRFAPSSRTPPLRAHGLPGPGHNNEAGHPTQPERLASPRQPVTVSGAGDDGGPHVVGYPKPQLPRIDMDGSSPPWALPSYPHRSGSPNQGTSCWSMRRPAGLRWWMRLQPEATVGGGKPCPRDRSLQEFGLDPAPESDRVRDVQHNATARITTMSMLLAIRPSASPPQTAEQRPSAAASRQEWRCGAGNPSVLTVFLLSQSRRGARCPSHHRPSGRRKSNEVTSRKGTTT